VTYRRIIHDIKDAEGREGS